MPDVHAKAERVLSALIEQPFDLAEDVFRELSGVVKWATPWLEIGTTERCRYDVGGSVVAQVNWNGEAWSYDTPYDNGKADMREDAMEAADDALAVAGWVLLGQ